MAKRSLMKSERKQKKILEENNIKNTVIQKLCSMLKQ